VSLGDRGQPAGDGGRAEGGGPIGDVEGDRGGSRREVGQVVLLAESGEVLEVGPVGAGWRGLWQRGCRLVPFRSGLRGRGTARPMKALVFA
jgi:hypothetical protein